MLALASPMYDSNMKRETTVRWIRVLLLILLLLLLLRRRQRRSIVKERKGIDTKNPRVCSVRYRYSRYRYRCRTELTEVSGTGIDVVPNLPKCPVPVLEVYQTYRSTKVCTGTGTGTGTGTHLNTYTGSTGGIYRRQDTVAHLRLDTKTGHKLAVHAQSKSGICRGNKIEVIYTGFLYFQHFFSRYLS